MENHGCHQHACAGGSLLQALHAELVCHWPYAIFATALSLAILSFVTNSATEVCAGAPNRVGLLALFHSFHFMHIMFASTGTVVTYLRFCRSVVRTLVVGALAPMFFCVLSDAILPYVGGRLLGVDMYFHICFFHELKNVLPFLAAGILNGFVMKMHYGSDRLGWLSLMAHTGHIFVSALASMFYLVAHGFSDWANHIGAVFVLLVICVVLPCTMSDVVVPMILARTGKKNEKYPA